VEEKEEKGKARTKLLLQGPVTKVQCSSPAEKSEKLIQGLSNTSKLKANLQQRVQMKRTSDTERRKESQ